MNWKDLFSCTVIILGPSWVVAYYTDKVVYVIPMLALCTFVVAQLFQNRSKRSIEDAKKGKGKKNDDSEGNYHDGHHTGDH